MEKAPPAAEDETARRRVVRADAPKPQAAVPGSLGAGAALRASPLILSRTTVLHLQRIVGNQVVQRMIAQRAPTPEEEELENAEDDGATQAAEGEDLTLEQEQELIQAKRVQRAVASPVIQRAWTGRRQLGAGALTKLLGKPWVLRQKGNLLRWGGYHEHIFFEDRGSPPNVGHMGQRGLGQDTGRENEYARVEQGLNDGKMRKAVSANRPMGEPGKYALLSNNCQDFVQKVLETYRGLP